MNEPDWYILLNDAKTDLDIWQFSERITLLVEELPQFIEDLKEFLPKDD